MVHIAATRHPTQAWTAQQLRNATMDGDAPTVLLRDRDDKFDPAFDRAAHGIGAEVIRTAVRAPNMNAVSERFVGSVRRELLDHVLLVDDLHPASLVCQYARYFNECRPHQGLGQRVPTKPVLHASDFTIETMRAEQVASRDKGATKRSNEIFAPWHARSRRCSSGA